MEQKPTFTKFSNILQKVSLVGGSKQHVSKKMLVEELKPTSCN